MLEELDPKVGAAIRERAAAGADEYLEHLRAVVAMPTVNPPGDEGRVARYLGEVAGSFGASVSYPEPKPGRPNVVAEWVFGAGGPAFLLTSHMDVVPAPAALFQPWIEGERLYGRGACDAKGPLVSMLAACRVVADLARSGGALNGRLVWAGVIDEESGGSGTDHLAANGRFDAAVVGEPTGLKVVRGHRGALRRHVVFLGRAAHSSEPARGSNAIYRAARFALGVEALNTRLAADSSGEYGAACASVTVIAGGTKVNVVPDRCAVQVDRRLRPGETVAGAAAEIRAILDGLAADDPELRWQEVPMSGDKDPAVIDAAHPFVQAALRAGSETLNRPAEIDLYRAGTDMVFLSSRGVPTVVIGPGHIEQAHTEAEFVPVPQLVLATEIYARLAYGMLGGAARG